MIVSTENRLATSLMFFKNLNGIVKFNHEGLDKSDIF